MSEHRRCIATQRYMDANWRRHLGVKDVHEGVTNQHQHVPQVLTFLEREVTYVKKGSL